MSRSRKTQTITVAPQRLIGIVEGSGGGKGAGSSGGAPKEDKNTLQSKTIAKIIELIGEGEVGGLVNGAKSIALDDTPLQNADDTFNFEGIVWTERKGLPDQDHIEGFNEIENEVSVSQEVKFSLGPVIKTISTPNLDALRVTMRFPSLTYQDEETGDLHGSTVEFFIEVRQVGAPTWTRVHQPLIEEKCVAPAELQYRIQLPQPGPWQVQVGRITPDAENVNTQNKTFWTTYTEIIEQKLTYPDSALIALTVDAEQFGSRIPRRAYQFDGLKTLVPVNYDPDTRAYTGIWNGTFKTAVHDNPAWCLYDMLQSNRYGLQAYIPQEFTDTAALYAIGQYCDELVPDGFGGFEPRYRIATSIATREQAYTLLQTMVSIFRGMLYWASSTVLTIQDSPRDVDIIATPANVIDGQFDYSSASDRARHNMVVVTWNDQSDYGRQATEVVVDNEDIQKRGLRKAEIVAWGAPSRGQAHRMGRWMLFTEKYESQTVRYRTGLEGAMALPGFIVGVVDPSSAGAQYGGAIKAISGNTVTLDRACDLTGSQYEIWVINADGTIQKRQITQSGGTFDTVTVTSSFSPVPAVGTIFALSSPDLTPRPYRVIGVVEVEENIFEINGIAYEPSKYAAIEQGYAFEPVQHTRITSGPLTAVSDVYVAERLYLANGVVYTRVLVSWTRPDDPRVGLFEVNWRVKQAYDGATWGPWEKRVTPQLSITIDTAQEGVYQLIIYAMAQSGQRAAPFNSNDFTIYGKSAPPQDVTGFVADRDYTGVMLRWNPVTDIDLIGYEIRRGISWESGEIISQSFIGTQIFVPLNDGNPHTFFIRAEDQSGNLSVGVSSVTAAVLVPPPPENFQVVQQQGSFLYFSWNPPDNVPSVEFEIREGGTWEGSQFLALRPGSNVTLSSPGSGERTFWIKSVTPAGVYSTDALVFVLTQAPDEYNVVVNQDHVALSWSGMRWNMEIYAEPIGLGVSATMVSASKKVGEYTFEVSFATSTRARNWIQYQLKNSAATGLTWQDASITWQDANFPWTPVGDIGLIEFIPYVCAYTGTGDLNELYGFRLDGNTQDFRNAGLTASQSVGVTYGNHRFKQGAAMQSSRQLSWSGLTIPATFSVYERVKINALPGSGTFRVLQIDKSTTHKIYVDYDVTNSRFTCGDHLGNLIHVSLSARVGAIYYICVAQDASNRTLYVHEVANDLTFSATAAYASGGTTYDRISPYSYNTASYNGQYVVADILVRNDAADASRFATYVNKGPVGYGQWLELVPGDYDYTKLLVNTRLRSPVSADGYAVISALDYFVDVPDKIQTAQQALAASVVNVTFPEPFLAVPVVAASFITGAVLAIPEVTNITTTGFQVALKRAASPNDIVAGTISWIARGY